MYLYNIVPRILNANIITAIPERTKSKIKTLLWQLAVPLAFMAIVILFFPSRGRFELNSDEGVNLMKAMLLEKGFPLYEDIWSDQPPVFTYLLAGVIRLFGYKVGATRVFVLVLSAILLWAFSQILRMNLGQNYALVGAAILFISPNYMSLSISTMVGLPSIAFGMVSLLALTAWHKQRKHFWLIISAIMLSISVLTKLFTGFLAPIMVLGLFIAEYARERAWKNWVRWFIPSLLWGLVFTLITLGLGILLIGSENLLQLLDTHIAASRLDVFNDELFTINYHLRNDRPFLFLSLVGVLYTFRKKRWVLLYPAAWMVTAYILLLNHLPVWFHQKLLVTIPSAMLAAVAATEVVPNLNKIIQWQFFKGNQGLLRLVAFLGVFFLLFTIRVPNAIQKLTPIPSISTTDLELRPREEQIFKKMVKNAPETRWVITDLPMYAFRAGLPVPPNLAAFTMKRYRTGNLTEKHIIEDIQEYQPEQILLGRDEYPLVEAFIKEGYRLIHTQGSLVKYYLRNDL